MTWRVVLPGQPPSWNKSYKITQQYRTGADGSPIAYSTLSKHQVIIDYQDDCVTLMKSARPSRWAPAGLVRIYWDIFLTRDIDCDNLMKAIHDALERATGIDDKRYLPCVRTKVFGVHPREARVELEIEG